MEQAELDSYEQEIEDNFGKLSEVPNKKDLLNLLQSAATIYLQKKKPINEE
jgi:hypothetical protein